MNQLNTFFINFLILFLMFLAGNMLAMASGTYFHPLSVIGIIYGFNTIIFPSITIILGIFFLSLGVIRNKKAKGISSAVFCFIIASMCIGLRIYATHIEPYQLTYNSFSIYTPKVEEEFSLLHISDIQTANVGPYEKRVFDRIRNRNADIILFTGDLLQPIPPATYETEIPKLNRLFNSLNPPLGIYAVYGNVDFLLRRRYWKEQLENITFLLSDSIIIKKDGGRIRILGLSEEQSARKNPIMIREWLDRSRKTDINIVMGHRPDYMTSVTDIPIDLCLAGHTHGGQIVIPGFGPPITFSDIPREWPRGYHQVGKTRLHVSAGIGCENAPYLPNIRFFCPPEITLFHFRPVR